MVSTANNHAPASVWTPCHLPAHKHRTTHHLRLVWLVHFVRVTHVVPAHPQIDRVARVPFLEKKLVDSKGVAMAGRPCIGEVVEWIDFLLLVMRWRQPSWTDDLGLWVTFWVAQAVDEVVVRRESGHVPKHNLIFCVAEAEDGVMPGNIVQTEAEEELHAAILSFELQEPHPLAG